jgi:hypothetical protein
MGQFPGYTTFVGARLNPVLFSPITQHVIFVFTTVHAVAMHIISVRRIQCARCASCRHRIAIVSYRNYRPVWQCLNLLTNVCSQRPFKCTVFLCAQRFRKQKRPKPLTSSKYCSLRTPRDWVIWFPTFRNDGLIFKGRNIRLRHPRRRKNWG